MKKKLWCVLCIMTCMMMIAACGQKKAPEKKKTEQAEGVTVNAWSYDWIDPEASLKDGYKLINSCDTYHYIVPSAGYYRDFLDHQWLYETWSPWLINKKLTLPEGTVGVLGVMFAVAWVNRNRQENRLAEEYTISERRSSPYFALTSNNSSFITLRHTSSSAKMLSK